MRASLQRVPYLAQIAALAAVYFVAAKLSLLLAIPPGYATAVWPPSGIAMAAALLLGRRVWPGIWLGAAAVNLTVQSSVFAAVMIGTGNTLEALVGAALIQRFIGVPYRFDRAEDVLKFVGLAMLASVVAATMGVGSLALLGSVGWPEFLTNWWTWWQGDAFGIIVVTPLVLSYSARDAAVLSPAGSLERVFFGLLLLVAVSAIFGNAFSNTAFLPFPFMILPFIIWAAFRFKQREVTTAIAIVCAIAMWYTLDRRGPFASASVNVSLLLLMTFIATVVATGLVLSATVGARTRAMEELRKGHDELELRVRDRTLELERANRTLHEDIAARIQLQQQLQESDQRFRLLIDGIQDYAILMLDPEGHVVSWNAGAEKILGYKAEEIFGAHVSRFYLPDAVERNLPDKHLRIARADGRFETEGWRMRKDGTRFWANVIVTALYDAEQKPKGFAKVTRDMTDRKRVEALEQSERQMNEFLAMLGHELRNPLAPIRNAVDLLRIKPKNDRTHDWSIAVIDRQVVHLSRLVDDLLDVSRITRGKIVLQKEPLEINVAVMRAVESSRPFIDARKHKLEINLSNEPLQVEADLTRLSQVVLNLLNNAAKYTANGGDIRITVGREAGDAVIRVRDSGIGMTSDLLARAFDLFVQGDRSLDRSEGGLGIGLTLVKRLVELHGGFVEARSEGPGQGSEFIVRLPLLAQQPIPAGVPEIDNQAMPHARRRVLIVDDNRDQANTMAALLQAWGHEVRIAYDGRAAVALASGFRPQAVLLDIGLPGMNGYDVARRLRDSIDLGPMTIVAFTGYGQDEDRRRVIEAGFDHHLVKPVDPAILEKIIGSIPAEVSAP